MNICILKVCVFLATKKKYAFFAYSFSAKPKKNMDLLGEAEKNMGLFGEAEKNMGFQIEVSYDFLGEKPQF